MISLKACADRSHGAKMARKQKTITVSSLVALALGISLAGYFTFAAVQGDYGVFRRLQIEAEKSRLETQLQELRLSVAVMENKTRRMSDHYLDLDLLDEQARKVLGLARGDEIVVR